MTARPAVFLDRDGVLIEDVDLLVREEDVRVIDGVGEALATLADAGYALVVVTNQTVVSRGLAAEEDVEALNRAVLKRLVRAGAPAVDGVYMCPHHPNATLERYRVDCDCRKPRPGLLLRAAAELGLAVERSTMVGDRRSDVVAGALAGCATVLVQSGAHREPPIESPLEFGAEIVPDQVCADLRAAAAWVLSRR